jgi:hypothetical protein
MVAEAAVVVLRTEVAVAADSTVAVVEALTAVAAVAIIN